MLQFERNCMVGEGWGRPLVVCTTNRTPSHKWPFHQQPFTQIGTFPKIAPHLMWREEKQFRRHFAEQRCIIFSPTLDCFPPNVRMFFSRKCQRIRLFCEVYVKLWRLCHFESIPREEYVSKKEKDWHTSTAYIVLAAVICEVPWRW